MTKPTLHPWLSTPEAVKAARAATRIPESKLPSAARATGSDELFSEALAILTECAMQPRERGHFACAECGGSLVEVRAGAKFCSRQCKHRDTMRRSRAGRQEALPAMPKGHIGSMWSWPEGERPAYATREVGLVLCNYLRTRLGRFEIPATPGIENANVVQEASDPEVREILEDFLTAGGVQFEGDELLDELAEAAQWLRKAEA